MFAQIPTPRTFSIEACAAILAGIGSGIFALWKLVNRKRPDRPETISRADFYAEMLSTRERINANHLSILDKLDGNHRELLAALERQVTRINALETGLARVDERTSK